MRRSLSIIAIVLIIVGAIVLTSRSWRRPTPAAAEPGARPAGSANSASRAPAGVATPAPAADAAAPASAPAVIDQQKASSGAPTADPTTPALASLDESAPDAPLTPQQRYVSEGYATGQFPERRSSAFVAPFDPQAWARDEHAYLDSAEPGRVFATAAPGPEVPELRRETDEERITLVRGERARLAVIAPPGSPVSFTSFDMGVFPASGLCYLTVKADATGLATAEFAATPGTTGLCRILAGSPFASGQVRFSVMIAEPATAAH